MDNKQSYKEYAFDPKELRRLWSSIMLEAEVAKKRYAEQEKFFKIFHDNHDLFIANANALLPADIEIVKQEVKEVKVISMQQKYKKGEKHVHHRLDEKTETMEVKLMPEEEANYENLLLYIANLLSMVQNGKTGLERMVNTFKRHIVEVDSKTHGSGYKTLIDTLEKIDLTRHKPESLAHYKAGKTMFVNTLNSTAELLDLSQLANDEIVANASNDVTLFMMLNDLLNTTYAVIKKYVVEIIGNYTQPEDEDERKKLSKALDIMVEGNKLVEGYRWHIQEINANALQMILVMTKIQNYKSKLYCIHALFLENLFAGNL